MKTEIIPISDKVKEIMMPYLKYQIKMRETPLKEWFNDSELNARLSGTLKKNNSIGFKVMNQLRQEALCQTLGWCWENISSTYITFNDAISEGDCHPLTEVGWFADRWIKNKLFEEEYYELKYIMVSEPDGTVREGVGLICRFSTIKWLLPDSLLFCIIAEFNKKTNQFEEAINPF